MLAGGTARGQIAWIGGSDSNWSNSANWGGTVPGGGDVGLFQAGAAYPNQPNLTAPSPIGGLWNTGMRSAVHQRKRVDDQRRHDQWQPVHWH